MAVLLMVERSRQIPRIGPYFEIRLPLAAIKAKEDHGAPFQKLCRTLRAIQLDNAILTSRLGKKPGNLGKKVKNVIDSGLYSSRLIAINCSYAEVMGKWVIWVSSGLLPCYS
jgi:hypothetical protein